MLTLHRSKALVAAEVQADGSVLVIDGANEIEFSAEAFALAYAPASRAEVLGRAVTNGPAAPALPKPVARQLPAAKPGRRPTVTDVEPEPAPRKSNPDAGRRAAAQELYEKGVGTGEIAKRFQVTPAGVAYWAKTEGWRKPTHAKRSSRVCGNCGVSVQVDPCPMCGTAA